MLAPRAASAANAPLPRWSASAWATACGTVPTSSPGDSGSGWPSPAPLVNDPSIVFADEPTGNLDSATGRDIMQLLAQLHGSGATIILVTHEAEVAAYAGRVIHLRDGRITRDAAQQPLRPGAQ